MMRPFGSVTIANRTFEHGEILAYVRLLLGYANPPTRVNPAIRQIRFNFVKSVNPFGSHSMRRLAFELLNASEAKLSAPLARFGR